MAADVVVLGGGTGGVVVATSLARRLRRLGRPGRVVLVDRDLTYRFAPSFLWVMAGARRPEQVTADLRRLRRRGVELLQDEVVEVDLDRRVVRTTGEALGYRWLVLALGAETVPGALPGFTEAACDVYALEGAERAARALAELRGGRVVVLVSRLPYKCPAAPYEAAFLAEAVLRRRGARASVEVYTPEPFPMPTAGPEVGAAVQAMLARRGIGFSPGRSVERIEPAARELVFADGERVPFDLLLGIPPHRAPEVVRASGLGGETGFVPVDRSTLLTSTEGVFAIGDVTAIPIAGGRFLPKAGVFAHAQAEVVARRIADEARGRRPTAVFDGRGSCFVEMGDGVAAFATGDFYAEEGPRVRLRRAGRHWHLAKVAFERYWLRRWF
ncbi:MAG TPA: FAD/NAD(P)-binding oxidoreductase [Actinomycetota bacterium]|nr:FAD/NAD(P)-binding oxidoreductase [Actinomycetota bacterium]